MFLNKIAPAKGSKKQKTRVGRGIGSNLGKTCGRGHKGQKSRSGGFHKTGFEGGQMPIQRRLPKRGFVSSRLNSIKLRASVLNNITDDVISRDTLVSYNLISKSDKNVKIYNSANFGKRITLEGIKVTAGLKKIIETNGGSLL